METWVKDDPDSSVQPKTRMTVPAMESLKIRSLNPLGTFNNANATAIKNPGPATSRDRLQFVAR